MPLNPHHNPEQVSGPRRLWPALLSEKLTRWSWSSSLCCAPLAPLSVSGPSCSPGIFKIEDSAQVARLWGIRKNRPAMNYDKLSRSIRQYYKKGIIRKPDISQRLVYQFVHPI